MGLTCRGHESQMALKHEECQIFIGRDLRGPSESHMSVFIGKCVVRGTAFFINTEWIYEYV